MTPINHLMMSHHPPADAHQSCTLMLLVSKHDDHLSSEDELCYHLINYRFTSLVQYIV